MWLFESFTRCRDRLFARDPAAVTVRPSPRAVHHRPAEARELAHQTLRAHIEIERHASRHRLDVISQMRRHIDAEREIAGGIAELVIADEPHDVAAPAKARHAIVTARDGQAGSIAFARPAEGDVLKAAREGKHDIAVGIGGTPQLAVIGIAAAARGPLAGESCVRREKRQRRTGHDARRGGGRGPDEAPSVHAATRKLTIIPCVSCSRLWHWSM
jgi:hypothetical protein